MSASENATRWWILVVVSLAEMLAISVWLVSSAIAKELAQDWNLHSWQTGALTTSVQLGFVAGTLLAALLNLADIWSNRFYFLGCAILAGFANAGLLWCNGFETALVSRFFVGFFLAGVYPPAMKMIATWFQASRGFAIGTLIGALALGKATPFLLRAIQVDQWQSVVMASSLAAFVGAMLVGVLYRDGPFPFQKRKFSFSLVLNVLRDQKTRLAIGGYLGHMWELYAMWVWIGAFLSAAAKQAEGVSESIVDLVTFSVIGVGAIGCIVGGILADQFGRERFVNAAMAVSGLCCILIGLVFAANFWLCVGVALVWGFAVVADSAQFSTMVTEVSPQHAVGTALTLQTSLGFLLTTVTIQLVSVIKSEFGWDYAFVILALGPVFGIIAILRLAQVKNKSMNS